MDAGGIREFGSLINASIKSLGETLLAAPADCSPEKNQFEAEGAGCWLRLENRVKGARAFKTTVSTSSKSGNELNWHRSTHLFTLLDPILCIIPAC